MIPLGDATRRTVRFPLMTVTIVAANVLAFVWELGQNEAAIVPWTFAKVSYVPAFVLIGLWLLIQLFKQTGAVVDAQSGGVAYAAHVGGALFGIVTARLFERAGSGGSATPHRA